MNIEKIKQYFEEKSISNSIGHAYMFSNTNYENIKKAIEYILCSIIFKNNSSIDENPDVYFIEPEKNVIKKEKILELEENLSKTSQIGDSKVYIIKECDKLNISAANCLLKTLEEPGKNIYAFLITSNIDLVIVTIKSRCQIIQCEVDDKKQENETLIQKAMELIEKIEIFNLKSIAYCSNELYRSFEKEELKEVLKIMELFYKDCLNKIYGLSIETFTNHEEFINKVLENNKVNKIVSKMKILNDNIDLLKYNLNGNLFIDKILIEIGRL